MTDEYPNKIEQKELQHFCSSKLAGEEYSYRHSEDCDISGCKGHKAKIKYHSVTDIIEVDFGDGTHFNLDSTQANILWDWFNRANLLK